MQNRSNNNTPSKSNGLFYIVAGLAGALIGYLGAKAAGEQEKQPQEQTPIAQKLPSESKGNDTQTIDPNNIEDIICPITQEIMKDPYISKVCGHSFEKVAILGWISKNQTCPKCCSKLTDQDLIRNYSLKSVIEHVLAAQK